MKLVIATDRRFYLNSNGVPCCTDGSKSYPFWKRYLDEFQSVVVAARLSCDLTRTEFPVEGEGVSLFPITDYFGPQQYWLKRKKISHQISQLCSQDAAFMLRVPGQIGTLMQAKLQSRSCPYGVEVIADPHELFAPGSCDHPLRSVIRWDSTRSLRRICLQACGAAYVTKKALQDRYPVNPSAMTTDYSSVEMADEAYVLSPRAVDYSSKPRTILFVGTISQLYKGLHVLIDAFADCVSKGIDLRLVVVGDGKHRSEMETRCLDMGISSRVCFQGHLPAGEAIRNQMDNADLFVLPSLTEGLPRVMIEAMGRGLPCIGTDVGGIPELLDPQDLVPAGDVGLLAKKISELLSSPDRMVHASRRNSEIARRYHVDELVLRRRSFYCHLHQKTVLASKLQVA